MAAFLSETRERFLKAIARQVPPEQIAEVYFFAPMKQGGVESGIAVVAADSVPHSQPSVADAEGVPQSEPSTGDADSVPRGELSSGDAEAVPQENLSSGDSEAVPQENLSSGDSETPPPRRYTVYTARYRLTLKGPDRGRWETNIVAEADAPLLTVEAVVRGVQRRAGDEADPELMSGDEARAALEAAAVTGSAPGQQKS